MMHGQKTYRHGLGLNKHPQRKSKMKSTNTQILTETQILTDAQAIQDFPADVMAVAERFEATVKIRGYVESCDAGYGMETGDDYAEMSAHFELRKDQDTRAAFEKAAENCEGYDEEHMMCFVANNCYYQSNDATGICAIDKFVSKMRAQYPKNKISYNRDQTKPRP